jgi:hypothetical protein
VPDVTRWSHASGDRRGNEESYFFMPFFVVFLVVFLAVFFFAMAMSPPFNGAL